MAVVEKLPVSLLVMLFVIYLAIHIYLLWNVKNIEKKIDVTLNEVKEAKMYAKWFPFAYVIICILILTTVK